MDANAIRLLDYLQGYVTRHKQELIESNLTRRTRHITVVLEDIYQSQNASAVVRTCDCFGIQDLHVIEDKHTFKLNPRVAHGASKWVDIRKYTEYSNNTAACFQALKASGYSIIATTPDQKSMPVHDIDLSRKTAVVFGTENSGISDYAAQYADGFVTIPTYGFTESLNLSVSAAICASTLAHKLFNSTINWQLTPEEKLKLKLQWYRRIVNRSDLLEKEFLKSPDDL